LKLGADDLRARKITGVFRADNLDGFTRLLEAGLDVRALRRSADETVLLPTQ
jgi:ferric-dicitrate binding protein FerR (iron transport regulator)